MADGLPDPGSFGAAFEDFMQRHDHGGHAPRVAAGREAGRLSYFGSRGAMMR